MSSSKLEFPSLESIPSTVNGVRNAFHSQTTKPLKFRKQQLRRLYWGLKDNYDDLLAACKLDIGKGQYEASYELDWCMNDCIFSANKLDSWAKDQKAADIGLMNMALTPMIRKEPLGVVLIIGTFNFPLNLVIPPLVGAIAAGNTAIIKPSENAPNVARVIERAITSSLDPSCYRVIQGAVPETTILLDQKWDKIFYTGGHVVGTIVAKKAAETLTPYVLELGGRNPAIVTKNANIRLAARRLLWGKVHNAGQVCISQNYTLVEQPVLDAFVAEMKGAMKEFFPNGTRNTDDYGRLVNQRSFNRVKSLVDESKGKILMGGTMDAKERYIEPTMVLVQSTQDALMKEETFGPIITIMGFDGLDSALSIANAVDGTPLGLYPFGTKSEISRIMNEVRSGGVSINDAFMHGTIPTFAFGGVGSSGQGAYRGKNSFDCFTHERSYTSTPWWAEAFISVRYPPYKGKLEKLQRMVNYKPNFNRNGDEVHNILVTFLRLGALSNIGGLIRWGLLVLLTALGFRRVKSVRPGEA